MRNFNAEIERELIKVFPDKDEAVSFLKRSGFPSSNIPEFRTAQIFWQEVLAKARNGILHGNVARIIEQASAEYPDNPVFGGNGGKPESVSPKEPDSQSPNEPESASPKDPDSQSPPNERKAFIYYPVHFRLPWAAFSACIAVMAGLAFYHALPEIDATRIRDAAVEDQRRDVLVNQHRSLEQGNDMVQQQPCGVLYGRYALLYRPHGYTDVEDDDLRRSARECFGPGYERADLSDLSMMLDEDRWGALDSLFLGLGLERGQAAGVTYQGAPACLDESRDIARSYYVKTLGGLLPQHADIHAVLGAELAGLMSWCGHHRILLIRRDPPAEFIDTFESDPLASGWSHFKRGDTKTAPQNANGMLRLDRARNGHYAVGGVSRSLERPLPVTSRTTISLDLLSLRGMGSVTLILQLASGDQAELNFVYGPDPDSVERQNEDVVRVHQHLAQFSLRRDLRYRIQEYWPSATRIHGFRIEAMGDRYELFFDNLRVYECPPEWKSCTLGVQPRELMWDRATSDPLPEQRDLTEEEKGRLPRCPPDIRDEDVDARPANPMIRG